MTFGMLFSTALRALRYHKIRTILTMLGIIIGIAALITTMAIGRGAQKKIEAEISAMGSNAIALWAGSPVKSKNASKRTASIIGMKMQDMISLRKQVQQIKYITPMSDHRKQIVSNDSSTIEVHLKGVNETYLSIAARSLKAGRNFTPEDNTLGRRVALLGSEAAELLFKKRPAVGNYITLNARKYLVIGIIKKVEIHDPFATPNLDVFIPYTTCQRKIAKRPVDFPDYFFLSCVSADAVQTVVRQISNIMRIRHHLRPTDSDDFTVFDQQSYGKAKARSSDILSVLLLIIASISLLVGGIGVMNIMLVSVSERTREIGVRMALGATSTMILMQFIIESIVICGIGGFLGIITGVSLPLIIGAVAQWPISISPLSVITASMITMLVGIFFGIYPAHKASQLKPVTALQEQ